MKTKLDELRSNSRAVSPVIGVVLMIAVVVILAAVVGAFATGVFGGQQDAPQAAFSYDAGSSTVTMESGESISSDQITIEQSGSATFSTDDNGDISAGSSASPVKYTTDGFIRVVWNAGNGNSAVLFETQESGAGGGT